jgi:hypothetical protein
MTGGAIARLRLLDVSPVTALVGTRIYALVLPQKGALPAIRVQQIGETQDAHLRGPTSLAVTRVQVDCVASTKAAAEAIEAAVHGDGLGASATGLHGWIGTLGSPEVSIDAVFPAGRREGHDAEEIQQYVISRDYMIHWRM